MRSSWPHFERIIRRASEFTDETNVAGGLHPFETRNIHQKIPKKCRELFDDGHYSQATFEACKFIDKEVQRLGAVSESGFKLMMAAFDAKQPKVKLNALKDQSDIDEQEGYRFIFAGSMAGIRNPRGHEYKIEDDPDTCLDHLTLISSLLRRLELAGFSITNNT